MSSALKLTEQEQQALNTKLEGFIRNGDLASVKSTVENGVDINTGEGRFLQLALENHQVWILDYFLKHPKLDPQAIDVDDLIGTSGYYNYTSIIQKLFDLPGFDKSSLDQQDLYRRATRARSVETYKKFVENIDMSQVNIEKALTETNAGYRNFREINFEVFCDALSRLSSKSIRAFIPMILQTANRQVFQTALAKSDVTMEDLLTNSISLNEAESFNVLMRMEEAQTVGHQLIFDHAVSNFLFMNLSMPGRSFYDTIEYQMNGISQLGKIFNLSGVVIPDDCDQNAVIQCLLSAGHLQSSESPKFVVSKNEFEALKKFVSLPGFDASRLDTEKLTEKFGTAATGLALQADPVSPKVLLRFVENGRDLV